MEASPHQQQNWMDENGEGNLRSKGGHNVSMSKMETEYGGEWLEVMKELFEQNCWL